MTNRYLSCAVADSSTKKSPKNWVCWQYRSDADITWQRTDSKSLLPIGDKISTLANDPIDKLRRTEYPNPERVGCPKAITFEALRHREIKFDDPVWAHIEQCSPCYCQFAEIREELFKQDRITALRKITSAAAICYCSNSGRCELLSGGTEISTRVNRCWPPNMERPQFSILRMDLSCVDRRAVPERPQMPGCNTCPEISLVSRFTCRSEALLASTNSRLCDLRAAASGARRSRGDHKRRTNFYSCCGRPTRCTGRGKYVQV